MFFEGLIDKIIKEKDSSSATREEITGELAVVRQELLECKNYYEQYLIQAKM